MYICMCIYRYVYTYHSCIGIYFIHILYTDHTHTYKHTRIHISHFYTHYNIYIHITFRIYTAQHIYTYHISIPIPYKNAYSYVFTRAYHMHTRRVIDNECYLYCVWYCECYLYCVLYHMHAYIFICTYIYMHISYTIIHNVRNIFATDNIRVCTSYIKCCSVLQCVAVCCSVLQCVAV